MIGNFKDYLKMYHKELYRNRTIRILTGLIILEMSMIFFSILHWRGDAKRSMIVAVDCNNIHKKEYRHHFNTFHNY